MGLKQVPVEASAECGGKQINSLLLLQNLLHYSGFRGRKKRHISFTFFLILDGSLAKQKHVWPSSLVHLPQPSILCEVGGSSRKERRHGIVGFIKS